MKIRSICTVVLCLLYVGCGGSRSTPTAPSPSGLSRSAAPTTNLPVTPQGGVPVSGTGLCAGKPTWRTNESDASYCILSSDLQLTDGICQKVDVPNTPGRLRYSIGVVTGAAGGYVRQATNYADPSNDCSATEGALGSSGLRIESTTGTLTGSGVGQAADFPPNSERTLTFVFDTQDGHCGKIGATAELRAPSGGTLSVAHFVFRYPEPCRTCDSAGLALGTASRTTESSDFFTISASYRQPRRGDRLTLSGNGVSQTLEGPGAFAEIEVPRDGQTRTYTVRLDQGDSSCEQSITVTPPRTCALVNPQLANLTPSAETDTTATFNVTANVPGTFTPPQPVTFTRGTSDASETIRFVAGELSCPASSAVTIPRLLTCAEKNPPAFSGSGSWFVEQRRITIFGHPVTQARANVSATYSVGHYGTVKVGLLRRGPRFKNIVQSVTGTVPCGTTHGGSLAFTSTYLFPFDLLFVGPDISYSLVIYSGSALNPTIVQEIPLTRNET